MNQIIVPPSFQALFQGASGRLTVPVATLLARYELCEDLAQQLSEPARHLHFDLHVERDDVLAQLRTGLSSEDAGLSPEEVGWVVTRLAELMDWLSRPSATGAHPSE